MSETNVIQFNTARPRRQTRRARPAIPAGAPLSALLTSWEYALEAQNKAPTTIEMYTRVARRFIAFLSEHQLPADAEGVEAEHVRRFLISEKNRAGVSTSASAHTYLNVWWNWIIAAEERSTFSPVLKADRPHVPQKVREYLADEEMVALLDTCKVPAPKDASLRVKALRDFVNRRDLAILMILFDNGMRVSGLTGLHVDDVDLRGKRLRIRLKGGDEHWAPIGSKVVVAIDRYLRIRATRHTADSPNLWLGLRGKSIRGMTVSGVQKMLAARGEQAGVPGVHPHLFRGTATHNLLKDGASDSDVQSIMGWKDPAMVRHYGAGLAAERARATHARLSPADRL